MNKTFEAIDEPLPGRASRAWIEGARPHWQACYERARAEGYDLPDPAECRRRIAHTMPELLGGYDAACALVPDDPLVHVSLAEVDPPPMIPAGCTVRALRSPSPVLVRNYDFHPDATSGVVVRSRWRGRTVVGMGEGVIGYLDGINDAGLVGAITFGGRHVYGPGFGVLLILRWVLEVAEDVRVACEAIARVPCAWSQNVLLLDAEGHRAVAHLSPDRGNHIVDAIAVTNHQSDQEASNGSRRRLDEATALDGDEEAVVRAFHRPPLFGRSYEDWMATLYTAVYRPVTRDLELCWPGQARWRLGIESFTPGERDVRLPDPA